MRHHGPVRSAAVAGVLFLLAACSPTGSHHHARGHAHAPLPGPSATPSVVKGRAPVVWVSGQIVSVQPSRLTVVEALILALVSEEFTVDRAARRWLDDDEFLVRRRIHRDMHAAQKE